MAESQEMLPETGRHITKLVTHISMHFCIFEKLHP